jgi:hypothetical protein
MKVLFCELWTVKDGTVTCNILEEGTTKDYIVRASLTMILSVINGFFLNFVKYNGELDQLPYFYIIGDFYNYCG